MAPCMNCPGSEQGPAAPPPQQPLGTTELKYVGGMQGGFTMQSPSGKAYQIAGRGDQFFAADSDLEWFSRQVFGGGPAFIQVVRSPANPVVIPTPPQQAAAKGLFSQLPPVEDIPDVTALSVTQLAKALATVEFLPDLRIMLADENGREGGPREPAVALIEERIKELSVGPAGYDG